VDLETIPLYVRAGAIVPLGPVKQFTGETKDEPLSISVFPGSDASFLLYEDDGISFDYRTGKWMGLRISWNDQTRLLTLSPEAGSRLLRAGPRIFRVRALPSKDFQDARFEGRAVEIRL
jgi:alpha-glucosidase (family GH31 glycosyl hydrolase)